MKLATLAAVLAVLTGLAVGVGGYTFVYARGTSYLTNDPAACANCHVMEEYYSGWLASSHRAVATCNDCHTPHNLAAKYVTKASNGFWHSLAFTTGWFQDPIQIKPRNRRIAQASCLHCHAAIVDAMAVAQVDAGLSCVRCHGTVGHPR